MKDREPSPEAREEQTDAFSFIIAKIKDTDRPSEKSIARAFSELRDKPFGVARTHGETFQPGQSLSFCAARLAILRDGIIHTPTLGMVNNREEGNKFFALLKKAHRIFLMSLINLLPCKALLCNSCKIRML